MKSKVIRRAAISEELKALCLDYAIAAGAIRRVEGKVHLGTPARPVVYELEEAIEEETK